MFFIIVTLCVLHQMILCKTDGNVTEDPSLWPGHLEPFGSKQKVINIEEMASWPSPLDFFENFVDRSKPMLFKGLAKRSPAFHIWEDNYLANLPDSDTTEVYIEPEKKENREKEGRLISFKKFIEIYKNESIYMVHGVPSHIQKDVLMPSSLRCDDTRPLMLDAVTWFSSGGTRSVLHNDDLDNVNCLFRGSKELLMIEYEKNKKFVPIDRLKRSYSSLDVDKVNYTKYPDLRKVDKYVKASMEAGDCVFIPYKWFHQVNSYPNEKQQNIAVNIWFQHQKNHRPIHCSMPPLDATIDKYTFRDLEEEKYSEEFPNENQDNYVDPGLIDHYQSYLKRTKDGRANLKTFILILKKDPEITERDITKIKFPKKFTILLKQLFSTLDISEDGWLDNKDFEIARDEEYWTLYQEIVMEKHRNLLTFLDDFLYNYFKGGPRDEL